MHSPAREAGIQRRIASDGVDTFVVEVKTFGRRDFDRVLEDARRVHDFWPNPSTRVDGIPSMGFWDASRRWGCVVIQSCTPDAINDLWRKQVTCPQEFEESLQGYVDQLLENEKPGFHSLAEYLRSVGATTGIALVCKRNEIWEGNPLNILWACFPVPAQ